MFCPSIVASFIVGLFDVTGFAKQLALLQLFLKPLLANRIHPRKRQPLLCAIYVINLEILRYATPATHTTEGYYRLTFPSPVPVTEVLFHALGITIRHTLTVQTTDGLCQPYTSAGWVGVEPTTNGLTGHRSTT